MEIKYRANPNIRSNNSTSKIMLHLTIGLLIVYAFGLYHGYTLGKVYFTNAIILMVTAVVCALLTEAIWAIVTKKNVLNYLKNSFGWVTAIIIVLTVTYDMSPYAVGVSTVLAIFFGKLVFGGFGQNIFNPAGVGRAIIGTSFAGSKIVDVLSGATPTNTLASAGWLLKGEAFATYLEDFGGIKNLYLGLYEGAIGETSTLLIIAVAIYLIVMKVIDWRIPVTYIGVIFIGSALIGVINGLGINFALAFIATGGIFFGGVFMLTDPVTDPNTRGGRIIFAAIAAIVTVLIRLFANLPEGVVFSILIANMLSSVIDKFFDGKQTDQEKRNNILVPAFVLVMVACIVLCGGGLKKSDNYKSIHSLPEFSHGVTVKIAAEDVRALTNSYTGAEVKSQDGNTYQIAAQGYDYTGAKNIYDITVEDGVITSFAMSKFADTKTIGDACENLGFLGQFVGKTIDDEVDVCAGATFTSYSAVAAARVALEGGK